MTNEERKRLRIAACKVRMGIIESTHAAKCGHPGGSLSAAEVLTYLYFKEMNIDPQNPSMDTRDRFVLSKGHNSPGLYAALAYRGFFPVEDLLTFRHLGSYLQGHPNMITVPGVDMSTGSLGQGISCAAGMALAAKVKGLDLSVYTLLGDGEIEEGEVWEAMMFASHYKLDNLCVIIDNNGLQIDGAIEDVMSSYPITDKARAFNFETTEIDGNDFDELESAFEGFHRTRGTGKPYCIVMKTIKGKGVSYMENVADWHGKAPNDAEYEVAMDELRETLAGLEAE